jgi:hypothetical protein
MTWDLLDSPHPWMERAADPANAVRITRGTGQKSLFAFSGQLSLNLLVGPADQ